MAARNKNGLPSLRVDGPSGETTRRLADVALGVMPFAEREELEHLAREIFIRHPAVALPAVEPNEHGRIPDHSGAQLAERPRTEPPQCPVLAEHEMIVAHLGLTGGEVAMPEKRQLFPHARRV